MRRDQFDWRALPPVCRGAVGRRTTGCRRRACNRRYKHPPRLRSVHKTTGRASRVSRVDVNRPSIRTNATLCSNSEPSSSPPAIGSRPAITERVVIRIGRRRLGLLRAAQYREIQRPAPVLRSWRFWRSDTRLRLLGFLLLRPARRLGRVRVRPGRRSSCLLSHQATPTRCRIVAFIRLA